MKHFLPLETFNPNVKAHEDGHVEVNKLEAENLKTDIESVLPANSTFTSISKTSESGFSAARRSLNVQEISSTIDNGLRRYETRNNNYERNSGHKLSPKDLKERGIPF